VRSSAESATLVAYLFDLATDGSARIITHEPVTLTDLTPDEDRTATWKLQAAGYDLPAGHRLMLVVNSKDKLYSAQDTDGSTTTIGSPAGSAAHLTLPLG
jgi:predicted acyl esterase